eukprot:GFUD01014975.1.p1 GENE.GFUD01014975.1~~GFUD01014975.1.p1  ORF type:complete len:229 (+),score=65.58 GFUD01014975.1:214-900(+)
MLLKEKKEYKKVSISQSCPACNKRIIDRYFLQALDQFWHQDCLKCSCCECRLGEVGDILYTKGNMILCKRDYLRLFGTAGFCAACCKMIPAFELVMRAKENVYHMDCFACQQCASRFCVGDKFFLFQNKLLCSRDYEDSLFYSTFPHLPPPQPNLSTTTTPPSLDTLHGARLEGTTQKISDSSGLSEFSSQSSSPNSRAGSKSEDDSQMFSPGNLPTMGQGGDTFLFI